MSTSCALVLVLGLVQQCAAFALTPKAATLRWSLTAAPWVHLVLLLIGLPFVLNFERQSSLEGVAVGLLLCALFFVADFLFQDLGQRGVLSPAVAGIAPVVLFGGLGLAGQDRLAT